MLIFIELIFGLLPPETYFNPRTMLFGGQEDLGGMTVLKITRSLLVIQELDHLSFYLLGLLG